MIVQKDYPHPNFDKTEAVFSWMSDSQFTKMKYLFMVMNNAFLVKVGASIIPFLLWFPPFRWMIKQTIFAHFCGGETIDECEASAGQLAAANIGTILDFSAEGGQSEAFYDLVLRETLLTVRKAATSPTISFCVFKLTGLASTNDLVRLNALLLEGKTRKEWQESDLTIYESIGARVLKICKLAYEKKVKIMIDAEESWLQTTIDHYALVMMLRFNQERVTVINTYQMYTTEGLERLKVHFNLLMEQNCLLGAKVVRGAYMEKERSKAEKEGFESPICADKAATDLLYNEALVFCVQHHDKVLLMAGTHNQLSIELLISLMSEKGLRPNDSHIHFAQLYGMGNILSYNLATNGFNVSKYLPYGCVKDVLPYLIRRAHENSSTNEMKSRELQTILKEVERRK